MNESNETTSQYPDFLPSHVVLIVPPLCGTMKKAEVEFAASVIVQACLHHGDRWQPLLPKQVGEAIRAAIDEEIEPRSIEEVATRVVRIVDDVFDTPAEDRDPDADVVLYVSRNLVLAEWQQLSEAMRVAVAREVIRQYDESNEPVASSGEL